MNFTAQNIKIDYHPFGSEVPGRSFGSDNYSYSFNGKEKDKNWTNTNSHLDFGARMYDSRLGRWLATDPFANKYPFASPYNFALNTPIQAVDPDGKVVFFINAGEATKVASDLNYIYEKEYGFKQAFKVVTKDMVFKIKNDNYQWWNPFSKEPKYIDKTYSVTVIETNNDFDWNTDRYTKAQFDILNMEKKLKVDIAPANSTPLEFPYVNVKLSAIKGYSFKNENRIELSSDLKTAKSKGWSLGGTYLHESTNHFHHLGNTEPAYPLQDKYELPHSSTNHNGEPKLSFSQEERDRLDAMRAKTGKSKKTK